MSLNPYKPAVSVTYVVWVDVPRNMDFFLAVIRRSYKNEGRRVGQGGFYGYYLILASKYGRMVVNEFFPFGGIKNSLTQACRSGIILCPGSPEGIESFVEKSFFGQ